MKQQSITETPVPTVHLTVNKSRRKSYYKNNEIFYYLNHGDEFELELFNGTQHIYRADIILNNNLLSGGGLVLKPGERVFLDRYLDTPKKFKFETYEVSKSKETEIAVQFNGSVKVQFYKEQTYSNYTVYNTNQYDWNYNQTTPNIFYSNSGITTDLHGVLTTNTTSGHVTLDDITSNTTNVNFVQTSVGSEPKVKLKGSSPKKETGRVGEGSISDQTFQTVNYNFEYFSSYDIDFKILPVSEQIHTVKSISSKRYCTNCGTKVKSKQNFCSNCGQRI